jgi:hypothetical protein
MIWLLRPDQTEATEFAPAMEEATGVLPGLPTVAGKPVHVRFDGGRLTSDAQILLLAAVKQRLKIGKRLAACLKDPRDPERVRHELAEMIRYGALHARQSGGRAQRFCRPACRRKFRAAVRRWGLHLSAPVP